MTFYLFHRTEISLAFAFIFFLHALGAAPSNAEQGELKPVDSQQQSEMTDLPRNLIVLSSQILGGALLGTGAAAALILSAPFVEFPDFDPTSSIAGLVAATAVLSATLVGSIIGAYLGALLVFYDEHDAESAVLDVISRGITGAFLVAVTVGTITIPLGLSFTGFILLHMSVYGPVSPETLGFVSLFTLIGPVAVLGLSGGILGSFAAIGASNEE